MTVTRPSQKPRRRQVTHDGAGLHCPVCGEHARLLGKDRDAAYMLIREFHRRHASCLGPVLAMAAGAVSATAAADLPLRATASFRPKRRKRGHR